MNKTTCFFIVIFAVSFAQASTAQLQLGFIGGLNIADTDVEIMQEPAKVSKRTVFGIGGVFDLSLTRNFSLRLEPMYLQKGAGKTELAIQPGVEWSVKSSYLELPVFFKAEFGSAIRPYIMAGSTIGLLLSSDLRAEMGGITFKGDPENATENIDVCAAFGGGVNFPMGRISIFLEGRYSYGLTDNVKGGTIEISAGNLTQEIEWDKETDMIKNRGLQILAGVTFPLGR